MQYWDTVSWNKPILWSQQVAWVKKMDLFFGWFFFFSKTQQKIQTTKFLENKDVIKEQHQNHFYHNHLGFSCAPCKNL